MADRGSSGGPQGAAGVGAPPLTLINLFPTPLVIASLPDAETLNVELKRIILAREAATESVQRSNHGGWQSSWDLHQWGGAPMQRVLSFTRAIADEVTVDRAGKRHDLKWAINCWANVNRQGHGNQFHTHPGALWSATYYVDDGGIGADASLGGEFEIQDPRGVAPVMYAPMLTFPGPDGAALGEAQRLTPRAGMCVVFPSWLSHGVRPYRGTRERISIAVNFSLGGG
ncbi:MAG TPA: TIGR02466 family protein [Gammaproteobacteria bacterium]|nr:TIGR02466 family protein [Gammaproteobacteria bacterium]